LFGIDTDIWFENNGDALAIVPHARVLVQIFQVAVGG
jgi:hypothetical protein